MVDSEVLGSRAHVPTHVAYRSFEGETVLLNLDSGQYHGLNETGGRMLELLKDGHTVRSAIDSLASEYSVSAEEIEPDMVEFCAALADRGLIFLDAGDPGPSSP